jgi:hypothetical protein
METDEAPRAVRTCRRWWSRTSAFPVLVVTSALIGGCVSGSTPEPSGGAETEPGRHWTRRTAGEGRLFGVAWSGSQLVAVGMRTVLTSPDGLSWMRREVLPGPSFEAVTWGASQFVAVGSSQGSGLLIATSPDGVTWTQRSAPGSAALNDVAWSGGRFVAVGLAVILTSADAVTWAEQKMPVEGWLKGATWGASQFVAVGSTRDPSAVRRTIPLILTSPDGAAWTQRGAPGSAALNDVAWSGDRFVAVGDDTILTSSDAVTWSEPKMPVSKGALLGVTWGPSQFVAVGRAQDPAAVLVTIPLILTSPDGVAWSRRTPPADGSLWAIVWGGTRFVGVGQIRSRAYYDALIVTSP